MREKLLARPFYGKDYHVWHCGGTAQGTAVLVQLRVTCNAPHISTRHVVRCSGVTQRDSA